MFKSKSTEINMSFNETKSPVNYHPNSCVKHQEEEYKIRTNQQSNSPYTITPYFIIVSYLNKPFGKYTFRPLTVFRRVKCSRSLVYHDEPY